MVSIVKPITKALESRIEKLERESLILNLMVTGIPWQTNENVNALVDCLCKSIGFNDGLNSLSDYYRLINKNSATENSTQITSIKTPPLVLKFWSYEGKQHFFKLYLNIKSLNLSHIGFGTNSRIYINEMLTLSSKQIFLRARQLQREKKIFQSHTNKGLVVIKRTDKAKSEIIYSMDQLPLQDSGARPSNEI